MARLGCREGAGVEKECRIVASGSSRSDRVILLPVALRHDHYKGQLEIFSQAPLDNRAEIQRKKVTEEWTNWLSSWTSLVGGGDLDRECCGTPN